MFLNSHLFQIHGLISFHFIDCDLIIQPAMEQIVFFSYKDILDLWLVKQLLTPKMEPAVKLTTEEGLKNLAPYSLIALLCYI